MQITGPIRKKMCQAVREGELAVVGLNSAHRNVATADAERSSGYRVAVQVFYLLFWLAIIGPASLSSMTI